MKKNTYKGSPKGMLKTLKELINADGALVDKGWQDGQSQIATNKLNWDDADMDDEDYPNPPQTTDDYADEVGQGRRLFYAYGYGVKENTHKKIAKIVKEVLYADRPDADMARKTGIPNLSDLSDYYEADSTESKTNTLIGDIVQKMNTDNGGDILAIVIKAILKNTDISKINNTYKKELMNILSNKK